MNYENIVVAVIDVGERMRRVDEAKVEKLAQSMGVIGLLSPIIVYSPDDETMDLVAGAHRLEAARRLGWKGIDAHIMDGDELHAQLAEIDENLMRAELTPTEEAEHLQRRKEIWEAMRAQQSVGGSTCATNGDDLRKDGRRKGQQHHEGFAESTQESTGKSKASTNRATRRARTVCQKARDIIRGTEADTGTFLDRLSKLDESEQIETAREKVESIERRRRNEEFKKAEETLKQEAKERRDASEREFMNVIRAKFDAREWESITRLLDDAGGTVRANKFREYQDVA